jgi:Rrf2 family protein
VVNSVELAEMINIPMSQLIPIMTKLKHGGMVDTERGKTGGYMLNKPLSEITLWDVIHQMERTTKLCHCLEEEDNGECSADPQLCRIRKVYQRVQSSIELSLQQVTLQDVAGTPDRACTA